MFPGERLPRSDNLRLKTEIVNDPQGNSFNKLDEHGIKGVDILLPLSRIEFLNVTANVSN